MKLKHAIKLLVLSATATASFSSNAAAVNEAEVNNSITAPQQISASGIAVDINAIMGFSDNPLMEDVDFYKFSARAGDIVTLDIDNGYKNGAPLNTLIAVFSTDAGYPMLRMNDDATVDAGSISSMDARIDEWVVPKDGDYIVGVSTYPRFFFSGGMTAPGNTAPMMTDPMMMDPMMMDPTMSMGMPTGSGNVISDYTLNISGVSAIGPKKINIEVKPGSDNLAQLNPRSKGKIPVAILGSLNFSAINVDTSSLTFGSTGNEQSLSKCAKSGDDVNKDGFYDLVCHFENQKAGFKAGDLEGVLRGNTKSGEAFEGRALLKVFPTK